MENLELYFLRSFEAEIAKEMLYYAAQLDLEDKKLQDLPELTRYLEHYGIYKTDIGVYGLIDNKIAGAAWVRLLKGENNKGFGYVDDQTPELVLAVKPEFRNQGVATKLMEQLMTEVAMSSAKMSLCVRENNPVIRLYERLGFKKLEGSELFHKERNINTFIMIKELDKAPQDTQEEEWYKATQKYRNDIY